MTLLLNAYAITIKTCEPILKMVLQARLKKGKEDFARIDERMGSSQKQRPQGRLIWIHAASVGEAQSALILIDKIGTHINNGHVLVTTGTVTSAALMEQRLPPFAFHQFIPIDNPPWIEHFLNHWKPDLAIWMESELWPNILMAIKSRNIPAILMNARLSDKSFSTWKFLSNSARQLLSCFDLILAQSAKDSARFQTLGARNVMATGNLKYSASPLPFDSMVLKHLKDAIDNRPLWVYASTHDGEEELACVLHKKLKSHIPNLLTIIVPRHPNRRGDIEAICHAENVTYSTRTKTNAPPHLDDDIYIADTMGELGLFYSLCPIAVIGRSFSNDGGGGHNPLEPAQLGCVVITGPNNQYQRGLYDDMAAHGAVIETKTHDELYEALKNILTSPENITSLKEKTKNFTNQKSHIIDDVMTHLSPYLKNITGQE